MKNHRNNSALAGSLGIPEVWWPLWDRLLGQERPDTRGEAEIAQLTADMARGGEDAFRQFFDRYFNRLLGYLLVLTHGQEDAAREALQAAMLRIIKHVRRFDSEQAFWNWLTVLARTALVDQERKRSRYDALLYRKHPRRFRGLTISSSARLLSPRPVSPPAVQLSSASLRSVRVRL